MFQYVATKKEYLESYISRLRKIYKEDIVVNNEVIGNKVYCEANGILIEIECYTNLNDLCIIRTNDENYVPMKGLIKVSDLFSKENIINGSVKVTNYILEGTDGIGKTTAIEGLLQDGIVCFDRNLDVICKYMMFDVPMEERISEYQNYLKSTKDKILFLVNMDEEELRRRISSRQVISEFDKYAVEYNQMYYDTYNEMKKNGWLNDKLFLLDCTGLSRDEQKDQIKRIILR